MKSARRVEKAKTPKDLAALFREWQELRIKVSQAELAAAQEATATETKVEGNGRRSRKPAGGGRTH